METKSIIILSEEINQSKFSKKFYPKNWYCIVDLIL